eukprot:Gb_32731 [translate_table: standard]
MASMAEFAHIPTAMAGRWQTGMNIINFSTCLFPVPSLSHPGKPDASQQANKPNVTVMKRICSCVLRGSVYCHGVFFALYQFLLAQASAASSVSGRTMIEEKRFPQLLPTEAQTTQSRFGPVVSKTSGAHMESHSLGTHNIDPTPLTDHHEVNSALSTVSYIDLGEAICLIAVPLLMFGLQEFMEDKTRLGSIPPSCHNKCNACSPCKAIQVPTLPTHDQVHRASPNQSPPIAAAAGTNKKYSNYKPMGWKSDEFSGIVRAEY